MNYYRSPGAKVTYTPRQTRDYISRKVRISRGLNMAPTRRVRLASPEGNRTGDGWRFWFQSPRGPAKDAGNWKVDVVRVEGGPSPPPYTFNGGQLCFRGDCYSVSGDRAGTPFLDEQRPFRWIRTTNQGAAWVAVGTPYATLVSEYGADNVKPNDNTSSLGFVKASLYLAPVPSTDVATGVVNSGGALGGRVQVAIDGTSELFAIEQPYTYLTNFFNRCTPSAVFLRSYPGFLYENGSAVTFTRQYTTTVDPIPRWFFPTFTGSSDQPNCIVRDPEMYEGPWPLPGGSGGGGTAPPGFLMGAGPWAYRCSCPDYTGDEPAYRVSLAPSTKRDRAFTLARPLSPCKHICCSAKSLSDERTLAKWVRQFAKDSTGREYNQSPSLVRRPNSLYHATRDAEYAFRKTQNAARKALGKERAEARARRAARRLSDKIGRMGRWNVAGDRNRITSSKKQGRFGEALAINYGRPINWAAFDPNYQDAFARDWNARVERYNERPDVRLRNSVRNNVIDPLGNAINRVPSPFMNDPLPSNAPGRRTNHMFDTDVGRAVTERVYGPGLNRVGTFNPTLVPTIQVKAPTAGSVGPSIVSNPEAYGF